MSRSALPVVGPNGEVHIPMPRRAGAGAANVDADATVIIPPTKAPKTTKSAQLIAVWLGRTYWLMPAAVALAICFIGIAGPGLWADELATWGITAVSWSEFWSQLEGTDASIGAYYVIVRAWVTVFGDSDLALRAPSAIAMAATAAIVAITAKRIGSTRAGLVAGLIFAILPTTSRFGQEARPYALATLAAAVATLLLVRMLERFTLGIALAYVAALTALGYLHLVAMLILAAHGLAVLLVKPKLLWRWTPTVFGALVLIAPLVLVGRQQQGNQIDWIPFADLNQLEAFPNDFFGSALVGGAVMVLGASAVSRTRGPLVAASLAVLPTALLFALGTFAHLWQQRYVLFTLVGWTLLAGLALARRGRAACVAAVSVLALIAIPGHLNVREPAYRLQDTAAVVALLRESYRPDDGIVYGLQDRGPGVLNRDILAHYLPADRQPKDLLVDRPMRTDGWMVASEHQDVAARLGDTRRIWVLRLGDYGDPLEGLDGSKAQVLGERYDITETWHTTGYTVALLTRKTPA